MIWERIRSVPPASAQNSDEKTDFGCWVITNTTIGFSIFQKALTPTWTKFNYKKSVPSPSKNSYMGRNKPCEKICQGSTWSHFNKLRARQWLLKAKNITLANHHKAREKGINRNSWYTVPEDLTEAVGTRQSMILWNVLSCTLHKSPLASKYQPSIYLARPFKRKMWSMLVKRIT